MLRTSRFALLACFHTAFVFSQEALSKRLAAGAADLELVRAACDAEDTAERVKRAFKAGGIHTVGERDSPAMRSEDL